MFKPETFPEPSPRSPLSPRTLWLLETVPYSVLYTFFLYLTVLLFLGITYLATIQVQQTTSVAEKLKTLALEIKRQDGTI